VIRFMLDTNICIYIIKKKPEKVIHRLRKTPIADIGISTITLSELEYGVLKSALPERNKIALAEFLAPLAIMAYDDYAAQHYGRIRASLEKHGTPIGSLDMLIAAHALSLRCTLVTNNEAEFARLPELKIANWTT